MSLNQNKFQNFLSSGPGIGLTSVVGICAILGLVAFILHFTSKKECYEVSLGGQPIPPEKCIGKVPDTSVHAAQGQCPPFDGRANSSYDCEGQLDKHGAALGPDMSGPGTENGGYCADPNTQGGDRGCRCDTDKDCKPDYTCVAGTGGRGHCTNNKGLLGDYCGKDGECKSGTCWGWRCVPKGSFGVPGQGKNCDYCNDWHQCSNWYNCTKNRCRCLENDECSTVLVSSDSPVPDAACCSGYAMQVPGSCGSMGTCVPQQD